MPVSPLTLACLVIATLFVAALPIVLFWRLRIPLALDRRDAIAGIAVFALFAMVIERTLKRLSAAVEPHDGRLGWRIRSCSSCAARSRLGFARKWGASSRCASCSSALQRSSLRRGFAQRDAVALGYGLGHGGAELWLTGVLVQVQWILFAVLENRGRLGEALSNLPVDTQMRIHLIVVGLTPVQAGVFIIERASALVFQIALSVLMWRGVRAGSRAILPLAIAVHAIVEVPAALSQAHVLPLVVVDTIYLVAAVPLAVVLVKLFRRSRHAA